MTGLSEPFLTAVLAYGPLALALALLLAALGVPLPATVVLLAGGAFVRQGQLNGTMAAALGLLGSVLGDSGSYCLGRCATARIRGRMDRSALWRRAQALFARHGALAILLSRFLMISLAPPINLIAGSSHYAFRRFLLFAIPGELITIALYGGLGYLFASQWEALSDLAGGLNGMLIGLLALAAGGLLASAYRRQRRAPSKPHGKRMNSAH